MPSPLWLLRGCVQPDYRHREAGGRCFQCRVPMFNFRGLVAVSILIDYFLAVVLLLFRIGSFVVGHLLGQEGVDVAL